MSLGTMVTGDDVWRFALSLPRSRGTLGQGPGQV